jgi:hypothetical protein
MECAVNASKLVVLLLSAIVSIAAWSASSKEKLISALDEIAQQSGLVRTKVKGIDLVYKRADATLTKYNKLLLKPVTVSFSKNFDPGQSSSLYKMNPPDREKIKTELAEQFAKVFTKELQEKGGYQMVDESGADVLEVRAAIVNLYINAPDVSMQTAGRVKVYTTDAGEMTLVMELRDSVTDAILAQVYDRRAATNGGMWTWSTSVSNSAEARQLFGVWATSLRKALDASRGGGAKS